MAVTVYAIYFVITKIRYDIIYRCKISIYIIIAEPTTPLINGHRCMLSVSQKYLTVTVP